MYMLENSGQSSLFGEEQVKAYCDGIQAIADEVRPTPFQITEFGHLSFCGFLVVPQCGVYTEGMCMQSLPLSIM